MRRKFSKIWRWLSLVLVFLLATACGKSTESQGPGLVVVDSLADSSGASSGRESSAALSESTAADESAAPDESSTSVSEVSSETEAALSGESTESVASENTAPGVFVEEDGQYTSKEEVAAYLHQFGHLPSNYISKNKAKKLGWDSSGRHLWVVAPGKSIGGGSFGNYEGVLPDGEYKECDIDFDGKKRGIKRLVYSDDGRIYYTDDHYQTFERLY